MILSIFGSKHLIGLGVVTLFVSIFALLFKRQGVLSFQKQKRWIILFTILFFTLELIKLIIIIREDGSFPIYHLPFHLCSMPLYTYPLLLLSKENSNLKKIVAPSAFATVFGAGLITLILPTNILGGADSWLPLKDNLLPIISFIYHGLMVLSAFMLVYTGYYEPKIDDIKWAALLTVILAIFASIANLLLDKDFMLLNYGNGSPLNFLIPINPWLYRIAMIGLAIILLSIIMIVSTFLNHHLLKVEKSQLYK